MKSFINFLPPWVETNIQPAFYDKESGTCIQQTARMYAKVNQLVRHFNDLSKETQETIAEYIAKFVELKDFVDNYFDNLDVQEEINNKLDEMTEDGTLEEIIGDYLNNKVYYIFPKDWSNSNIQSGDASLIKAFDKNILIDTGYPDYKDNIESFLDEEGVEHIDYLFISHYHSDHAGNVTDLFNDGYIDSNTVMYLPPSCNLVQNDNDQSARYNELHSLAVNNNIPVITPTEGSYLELHEGFRIYCYNVDVATLNAYDTTDSNNASMVNLVVHGGKQALFTGDANNVVISHLLNNGTLNNALDFYKVEHHGFNWAGVATSDFHTYLNFAKPKLAWIPANTPALKQNNVSASFNLSRMKALGTEMFAQFNNTENVTFVSTPDVFERLQGVAIASVSNAVVTNDIYVDSSTVRTKMDGTQDYPFKDILQAIGYCVGKRELINIILADGTYNNSHLTNHNKDVPRFMDLNIRLRGNSADNTKVIIKDGFIAYDSHITIDHCTLSSDTGSNIITVNGCNLHLSSCIVKNDVDTITSDCIAIHSTDSTVELEDSTFEKHSVALSTHSDHIEENNCTFKDCTTAIYLRNTIFKLGNTTWNNVTNRFYYKRDSYLDMNPVNLLNVNASSGTATLNDAITEYNELLIQSFDSNGVLTTNLHMPYAGNMYELNKTYKCKAFTDDISFTVDSVNPKSISFDAGSSTLRRIYGKRIYKEG